ncbi:MAG TPA: hypothetical protein VF834_18070 [Streptosporangiaceae bacterium]
MALVRKLAISSGLALAVFALSPVAADAGTGTPFSGSFSGTSTVHFVTEPPPQFPGTLCNTTTPCAVGTATGTGKLSHIGQVSATGTVAIRFTGGGAFTDAGQLVLTAKGGTLAVDFAGTGQVTSVGGFIIGSTTQATVTEHILAGTGKFVGVTGTATADQIGTLTAINLGSDCLGAPNNPCLQFTSFDSGTWSGTINR